MKLNIKDIRYLTGDDWRVLQAYGAAGPRGGIGVHKCISNLAKVGLIAKVKNAKYDGYRLSYGGLDYLALNTHRKANSIFSLGNQIGVGKESDIYISAGPDGRQLILKLHRLGRISFRSVKSNRDYLRKRSTGSWMYLSRLAAQKEHAFMRVLYREGFPVPEPVAWSRHTVVMEFIDAFPLRMIEKVPNPGKLYAELMDMIVRLARRGLIHGDFNEFNILIKEEGPDDKIKLTPIVIDFPQTVSTNHMNAKMYFDRDVACIKRYFERRLKYTSDVPGPFFADALKGADPESRLDVEVEASGFSKKMAKDLDRYVEAVGGEQEESDVIASAEDADELGEEEEGFGEDDEDVVHETGEEDVQQDPEIDDPKLADQLGSLSVQDDFAVKPPTRADFGLAPLDLQSDADAVAEKVKSKKKASGWAI
ncbi:hypothetical protein NU195Hw_g8534t2 [Hortaea werneckii]